MTESQIFSLPNLNYKCTKEKPDIDHSLKGEVLYGLKLNDMAVNQTKQKLYISLHQTETRHPWTCLKNIDTL